MKSEIYIYGEIGEEVRAARVTDQLRTMAGRGLHVRVNSGGGSVFEGVAIYNALANHKGRVTVTIDGIASVVLTLGVWWLADQLTRSQPRVIARLSQYRLFRTARAAGARPS